LDERGMFSLELDIAVVKPSDPIELIFRNGSHAKKMQLSLQVSD
jgi:hypothetical protein